MLINNSMLNKKIKALNKRIDDIPPPIQNINISEDPFGNPVQSDKRRGIIQETFTQTLNDKSTKKHIVTVEVEEIEQLGNMSRIKIIKMTGASDYVKKYCETTTPEIIESTKIEFFP